MYAEIGEEHEDDQRFQVAAADPDQRLAAAAGRERHPEAEQEAADGERQPAHAIAGVERFREVDHAGDLQRRSARDGDRDRQQPHAKAALVAEVHRIADRTHRAEVDARGDGAEDGGEQEGEAGDERRQVTGILHIQIISRRRCSPGVRSPPRLTPFAAILRS
jgi:hypothetical protein